MEDRPNGLWICSDPHRCVSYGFAKCFKPLFFISVLIFCCATGLEADAETFLSRWDQTLFDRTYDAPPRQEPIWTIMEGISDLGDYRGVMGASILLMAYGNESHRETGKLLSSAYMGAGILTFGIKRWVRRKRPLDETLGNPAMPSGHASIAFSVANHFGVSVSEMANPALSRCGTCQFLTRLFRTALPLRCTRRCGNRYSDGHARLA